MKRNGDKYDLIFVEQVFHLVEQQMLLKEKLALEKRQNQDGIQNEKSSGHYWSRSMNLLA